MNENTEHLNNEPKKSRVEKSKKKKSDKKKKAFLFSIPGIILIFLFLGISFLGVDQVITPLVKGGQPLSILLIGSDMNAYREETKAGTKPEKTDSLMLLTFNPANFRFVVTSIPRDTAIDYACMDMRGKVNEIYPASGNDMGCLEESIENFLNVPIDYYVKVNMDQIEEIIDSVGKLTITAYAADGYLSQENVEGTQTYSWVNGETYEMSADEALTYARARHDSEKDYGRGKRQQQVIMQVARKLLEQGLNISTIKELLSMVDTNMEPLLLKQYYDYAKQYQTILNAIEGKKYLQESDLSSTTWSSMYEYFEYSGTKEAQAFQSYLIEKFSEEEIKTYFFESNQLYNDTYNGYYITPDDQREEISNKLRVNLGLKEETPPEQKKAFGINDFGCEVTASNSCGSSSSSSPSGSSYTSSEYYEESYDDGYYDDTTNDSLVDDSTEVVDDTSTDGNEVIDTGDTNTGDSGDIVTDTGDGGDTGTGTGDGGDTGTDTGDGGDTSTDTGDGGDTSTGTGDGDTGTGSETDTGEQTI